MFRTTAFIVILLFVFACSSTKKITTPNPEINRQLWTADWSPDDRLIAVGGVDSVLRIYQPDLDEYKSFQIKSWIHCVSWHPDNKLIAVATLDHFVLLIDTETGKQIKLNHNGGSRAVDWNHSGEILAAADLDGVITLWDQQGGLITTIAKKFSADQAGTAYISLDWHPTEDKFVACNFQISLFDAKGNELLTMDHQNPAAIILCAEWHPSGKFFAIGDYGHNWEGENVPSLLHFWSSEGKFIKSISGSEREYRNISWNPDSTRLATASDVLRIFSYEGELLHQSPPNGEDYLWGVDWNSKGDRIVTSGRFETIAIWNDKAKLLKKIKVKK